MAVAYVSDVSAQDITGVPTTLTIPSVNGGGGNSLWILVTWRDSGQSITGVTYNGSATGITQVTGSPVNGSVSAAIYYLASPSGTADVVVTWNGAPFRIYGTAVVVSGSDTSALVTDYDEEFGTGESTTGDLTLTTVAGGLVLSVIQTRADEGIAPSGAGQTERAQENGTANDVHAASTTDASGTSVTVGWDWTTAVGWAHAAVSIAPSSSGTTRDPAQGTMTLAGTSLGLGFTINMPDEL
jgi:hypothetical protein